MRSGAQARLPPRTDQVQGTPVNSKICPIQSLLGSIQLNVGAKDYVKNMNIHSKHQELVHLIALGDKSVKSMSTPELIESIQRHGSVIETWKDQFNDALFLDEQYASALVDASSQLTNWSRSGLEPIPFYGEFFPNQLREIHEMPLMVWIKGLYQKDTKAVSVVGTRAPSFEALDYTEAVVTGLVNHGITVVSGLAEGIDTKAHQVALDLKSRTVAVLGNGLDLYYPKSNRSLQERIASEGMLLTQFKPDFAPTKYSFPMRNATMSGYSRISIIVEAGEHSGTRIQGRIAVGHGRGVIISKKVFHETQWGQELAEKPGVHVAKNANDAVRIANELLDPIPLEIRSRISELV